MLQYKMVLSPHDKISEYNIKIHHKLKHKPIAFEFRDEKIFTRTWLLFLISEY